MSLPYNVPISIAARLAGLSHVTFRRVLIDTGLVETWVPSMGGRDYVVLASLAEYLGREITEAEVEAASMSREAARLYQRLYRQGLLKTDA